MRIQILPLPSVVKGDDVEEPFALIVDQHDADMDEQTAEQWHRFKTSAGARALLIVPDTVEVVDRYAEPDPVAVREFNRLDDYMLMNFPNEPGVEGNKDSAVDVAIRLLNAELLRRDAAKAREKFEWVVRAHREQGSADV